MPPVLNSALFTLNKVHLECILLIQVTYAF